MTDQQSEASATAAGYWPPRPYARFMTAALSGVLLLATLYTLYFASDFAIPVVAAIVTSLVFAPLVRAASRWGLPAPMTGGFIVLTIVGGLSGGIVVLSDSASSWLNRAPSILSELEVKLHDLKRPVEQVKEASEKVEKLADVSGSGRGAAGRNVVMKPPRMLQQVFGTMQTILIQLGVTLVLLFFLIASGDVFKMKLVTAMPHYREKKRVLTMWRDVEDNVSIYLLSITTINLGLSVLIAACLYAIGLPNALLWGAMAGLLNFIPYLGALVGVTIVSVVAIISFDSLSHAAIAPVVYAACNLLESQLVTPSVLGRRLSLNPVLVFISVIFWGWLWGMPGAMLAVPLLIIVHVLCRHFARLRIVADFMTLHTKL